MKTIIEDQNYQMVAILDGRLDTAVSEEVETALKPLLHCTDKDIVIDCTKLDYISSSGLRIFLNILKSAKKNGRPVYLKGMKNDLRNVMAMTGFLPLFKFL